MKRTEKTLPKVSRQYKDTVFRKLFRSETSLLSLYNAVMGTNYDKLDDFEITDTENPIYIGMRNDVAFVADFQVHIYEHQSSINPNMPLRDLFYVAQLYGKLLADKNIFSSTPVEIPTPSFIVFYNGKQKQPQVMHYRLSDLYTIKKEPLAMDLIVKVININVECNEELVSRCEELRGYQIFVDKVRRYRKTKDLESAINQAIKECIEENVLKQFFMEHRKEVVTMSLWEFDQEKYDEMLVETGKAEGITMMNQLTSRLLADDRIADLKASLQDLAFQNQLLHEYCLV